MGGSEAMGPFEQEMTGDEHRTSPLWKPFGRRVDIISVRHFWSDIPKSPGEVKRVPVGHGEPIGKSQGGVVPALVIWVIYHLVI